MSKNLRGNILEVRKKLNEDAMSALNVLDKKIESIEATMNNFSTKTNVGIYKELAGQMVGYRQLVKQIEKTVVIAMEAAEIEHQQNVRMVSSLNR